VWDDFGCVWDAIADLGWCVFSGDTCQMTGLVIFPSCRMSSAFPPRGTAAAPVLDGKCGNGCGDVGEKVFIVRNRSKWVPTRSCERASFGAF
jgi:hypothetical protein